MPLKRLLGLTCTDLHPLGLLGYKFAGQSQSVDLVAAFGFASGKAALLQGLVEVGG